MARKQKNRGSSEGEFEGFVPAVYARSTTEAEEYRELLNDHDIPAIVETGEEDLVVPPGRGRVPPRPSVSRGVPILVPEALLDEASEILADRDFDDYRPDGDDREADADADEEEELNLEPGPRAAGSDADEEEPAPKPKAADNPFEEDEEAFLIEEEDDEDDDLGDDLDEEEDMEEEEKEEEEGEEEEGAEEEPREPGEP